ncbi:MAG: YqeG family HAD IIIA-type phosphatase [Bacilli bacterium]|nr:YqeG family HAD IIIA-type phosphatase [Bacilli bacterium]
MNKRIIPTYYAKSLFDVDFSFFKNHNIRYILSDLDNTLDSYKQKEPSERVVEFKKKCESNNIELIIISNNKGPRVKRYSDILNVRYGSKMFKPFTKNLKNYLNENSIFPDECIFVGDQLMTDIKCGNGLGIITLLTDPIVKEDQWQTKFNRFFDRPVRHKLKKYGLLKLWEENNG